MLLLCTLSVLVALAAPPELDELAVALAPTLSEWAASLADAHLRGRRHCGAASAERLGAADHGRVAPV